VDKQCGVPTDKGLCARSLTCKTHSMKAKRDVPGRSATYDALLLAYQKAHNPNFVAKLQEKEKALAATAEAKAKRLREKSKQRKRGGAAGKEAQALDERRDDEEEPPEQEEDLEEELEGILDALRAAAHGDRTRALPLAVPSLAGAYTARRRKLMRCRDLFRASIMASHGSYAPALPFVMASQGSAPPSARMAAANQAAAAGQRGIPWANAFVNGGAHPGPPPGWPNGAPPRPQPASGP
jgi:SAGA-associated factor 73